MKCVRRGEELGTRIEIDSVPVFFFEGERAMRVGLGCGMDDRKKRAGEID